MVTFDHVGTFPDGERPALQESERVSLAVRRNIARCRHMAQALAAGDFLPALFDEIGFRYSLPGRELMLRAARVYVRLSADELCPFTYRLVLTALSDGAGRWADGQLSYLLDTVRGGGLGALCRHDGCTISVTPDGISIFVRLLQPEKAPLPISITPDGIFISVRLLQL